MTQTPDSDPPPSTLDAAHELSAADQDRFYTDMGGTDALTVVVRAAIYIESQIIHLIEATSTRRMSRRWT